jgi:hypothetical protein
MGGVKDNPPGFLSRTIFPVRNGCSEGDPRFAEFILKEHGAEGVYPSQRRTQSTDFIIDVKPNFLKRSFTTSYRE